ncbi:MAG: CopD family protein [Alphaproteobacteria bacterium]|nr:CopD family protein [Alphaproteobacteria bacterium]
MIDFLVQNFNLVRGLHIISVIAWMAGMLMLPRIFVYHMSVEPGSKMDTVFKQAELRILRIIINPAMILSLVFGLGLVFADSVIRGWSFLLQPWVLTKIAALLFLFGWHGFMAGARRKFADNQNARSEKFWRMTNELPFIAAIIIVLSVTTKFLNH